MEKKKNFKCLNKSCGVSYTAESLGPCQVCGCEDTKLDEIRGGFKIILWFFVSLIIVVIVWSLYPKSDYVLPGTVPVVEDVGYDTITDHEGVDFECDVSFLDIAQVNCVSENKVEIITTGFPDSCGSLKYSIDDGELYSSNELRVNTSKTEIKIVIYYSNGEEIESFIKDNPCYSIPGDACPPSEDVSEFNRKFKRFVSDPKNNLELKGRLKTMSSDLGFVNKNIDILIDNEPSNEKLEILLNQIFKRATMNEEEFEVVGEFELNCPSGDPKIKIQTI